MLINLLMLLQIHRFPKFIVNISHLQTNNQLFFTRELFGVLFFLKSCLNVWGAAYTRVRLIHESLRYPSYQLMPKLVNPAPAEGFLSCILHYASVITLILHAAKPMLGPQYTVPLHSMCSSMSTLWHVHVFIQLFQGRLSCKSVKAYPTRLKGIVGNAGQWLLDWS